MITKKLIIVGLSFSVSLLGMQAEKNWPQLFNEYRDLVEQVPIIEKQYEAYNVVKVPSVYNQCITSIPVNDSAEPLVCLRYFKTDSLRMMRDPNYPLEGLKFNAGLPMSSYVRLRVYERLVRMQKGLDFLAPRFGYASDQIAITVYEALRHKDIQQLLFDRVKKEIKESHPFWSDKKIHQDALKKRIFDHTTGAAVDIRLWDKTQQDYLDMGYVRATFTEGLTDKQKRNRLFCLLAATHEGLINNPRNFWHFSYGDAMAEYWTHTDPARRVVRYTLFEQPEIAINYDAKGHLVINTLLEPEPEVSVQCAFFGNNECKIQQNYPLHVCNGLTDTSDVCIQRTDVFTLVQQCHYSFLS